MQTALKIREAAGPQLLARGWVEEIVATPDPAIKVLRIRGGNRITDVLASGELLERTDVTPQSTVELYGRTGMEKTEAGTAESIVVRCRAEPLPIDLAAPDYAVTRYRHLHIRSPLLRATAMFRHYIQKYAREYLDGLGFYSVHTPILTEASCVCSGEVFAFPYYGKTIANLIQSPWMYCDALVSGVERVYAINPSYRREREATETHLVEIWQLQVDLCWASNDEIIAMEEGLIQYIANRFQQSHVDLYANAGLESDHLETFLKPYHRITYDESLARLRTIGHELTYGSDYTKQQSDALSASFDRPYFITNYPIKMKNFWFPTIPGEQKLTPSNDLFAHTGHGEIIGGGERVYDTQELERNLEFFGHDLDEFDWFVETRRYGGVPHAGFSVGFDRLTAMIMGVDHINQATLFPRLPHGTLRP
ncbi:MAG: amino acid--tRNA ligase-related protein [Sulfuricaulis sp.]